MHHAFTAEQTRSIERRVMDAIGTDVRGLMRRVGAAVADRVSRIAPGGRITVLAGTGNNAGDGWVAASRLLADQRDVLVLTACDPDALPEPARAEAAAARDAGVPWRETSPDRITDDLAGSALVVDALFGFGVSGALREPYAGIVRGLGGAGMPVVSVDLPSGIEADTGVSAGEAVLADRTLAVLVPKLGHIQEPGRSHTGVLEVLSLDVDPELLVADDAVEVWDVGDVAAVIPVADAADHKGSRGRVVVAGGASGMTGAVALAGWGALRSGAGYVVLAVPEALVDVVDAAVVPAVVRGIGAARARFLGPDATEGVAAALEDADAFVIGCGLGRAPETGEFVRSVVRAAADVPVVIDADGLWGLGAIKGSGALAGRDAPTVLTPHPGEAARLLDATTTDMQADRVGAARAIAAHGVVCVLKGAGTVVASPDRTAVVPTGTPALATLGTGDVLAGAAGSLLAQGVDAFDAAYAAAYLHGLAGARAGEQLSDPGTTALDVAHALSEILGNVSASD